MYDPKTVNERLDFKFELELSESQRALLVASMKQEHFDLLQKVMEEELKKFNIRLMNTPISKPEEVIANHVAAQAVTQWYVGFMRTLAEMVKLQQYNDAGIGTKDNPEGSAVDPDFQ